MRVLFRLLGYLGRHRRAVFMAYLGLFGSLAFTAATPWMLKTAIDSGISQKNVNALFLSAGAVVAFSIGKGLFAYLQTYMGEYLSQHVAFDLRRDFYLKAQSLSFSFHDNMETGQMMSRATVDVETSRQFLSMGLLRSVYTFALIVVVAVIMISMNWQLALITFLTIPVVGGLSTQFTRRVRPLWDEVQNLFGVETSVLEESLVGIRAVKAYAQEDRQFERFRQADWNVRETSLRANRMAAFNQPFLTWILNLVGLAVLWYGGQLALGGSITIGMLVAFTEYRSQIAAPIRMLGGLLNMGTRAVSGADRIFQIIDMPSEVQEAPDAKPLSDVLGHVRYESVSFGYSKKAPSVLSNVTIDAKPGQTIALLGPTGSGKSSVLNLLPRYYDSTAGKITIDGVDIRSFTLESLRRNIGVVMQDVFMFNTTIRDNISYGKPDATQEEIERVAKIAHIHDFIESLPDGYDTWVAERGASLSGGQKQRIAIARTLLMDPKILVLDDSTSAVDMETEYLIQQALAELIKGRTSFVIAHRLRTAKLADQVLVLQNGRVVQRGTHNELVQQDGLYRDIYRLQLQPQEAPASARAMEDEQEMEASAL